MPAVFKTGDEGGRGARGLDFAVRANGQGGVVDATQTHGVVVHSERWLVQPVEIQKIIGEVVWNQGSNALIVDTEGKVGQRMLTLDRAIGDQWLISTGLASGDQVIVEGIQMLRPGTAVKVVPFKEGGTKRAAPENTARPIVESK